MTMSNSNCSKKKISKDIKFQPVSSLTAVIEIVDYDYYVDFGKLYALQSYFSDLAGEIHKAERENYRRGFSVINPEFRIISNRIYVFSPLYIEKDVPELSSMVFNLFVGTCNMILAVSLRNKFTIRGIAGVDEFFDTSINSGNPSWLEKKDTLILSDMLKIFSFDEIFPDGLDRVFIPPASLKILHGLNFMKADKLLPNINSVGIFFPDSIRNYPSAELAIYSDMLLETSLNDKKVFASNWIDYAVKHEDTFNVEELRKNLSLMAENKESFYSEFWKKFLSYAD